MAITPDLYKSPFPDIQIFVKNTFITAGRFPPPRGRMRASSAPPRLAVEDVRLLKLKEMHQAGQCKPCVYVEKVQTCRWGYSCSFCHFCPPGETLRRKKEKMRRIKEQQRQEKIGRKKQQQRQAREAFAPATVTACRWIARQHATAAWPEYQEKEE
eukprot:TRINITY_DN5222_c0_g1_i1.p1 TRINITY_DN5222_c0_g1~~TRINITY_DN5222_c0_g1_i1.p1  ORF type:complete len:175 (+),score=27.27 TRINITY_DN5222_c0_g1_i1:60-527(+)